MNVARNSKTSKKINLVKSLVKNNQQKDRIAIVNPKHLKSDISKFYVTGEALLNMKITEIDYLLEGIIPRTGVIGIGGSSDTGKSAFLRQFALHIASGKCDFIGFELKPKYNSAIYISTEDDEFAISRLLNKQTNGKLQSKLLKNLKFIFETDKILFKLESILEKEPVDCMIIDTFTDIFSGDMNAANKLRNFLNDFVNIGKKYKCLVIFLHHTNKSSEKNGPNKNNLNGSQGFEAKMRLVIEFKKDPSNIHLRHMCIVKGNYLPEEQKNKSYVLRYNKNQTFSMTSKRVSFENLAKRETLIEQKITRNNRILKLKANGSSVREIEEKMKSEGFKVGKSTISKVINDLEQSNPSENLEPDQTNDMKQE